MKIDDSINRIKESNSISDITPKVDFVEELAMRSADISHKKYGNMLVLY